MHVCTHKMYMYLYYVIFIITVEPLIKDTILRTHKKNVYKGQKTLYIKDEVTLLYFQRIFNLREEDTSLLRTKIVRPSMSFVPLYLCMQMFYQLIVQIINMLISYL